MHQSSGNVGLIHPVVEHGGNPAIVALEVCERHARAACGVRCCGACISLRLLEIIGENASFSLVDKGSQKAVQANQDSLDDGICWPGMLSGTAILLYEDGLNLAPIAGSSGWFQESVSKLASRFSSTDQSAFISGLTA